MTKRFQYGNTKPSDRYALVGEHSNSFPLTPSQSAALNGAIKGGDVNVVMTICAAPNRLKGVAINEDGDAI